MPIKTKCISCKKIFNHAPSDKRKFCSPQCFQIYKITHQQEYEHKERCPGCGKLLTKINTVPASPYREKLCHSCYIKYTKNQYIQKRLNRMKTILSKWPTESSQYNKLLTKINLIQNHKVYKGKPRL
jgi:endogenous inhibitor of DNA gyrase (YacG/DUF329 family)